ncbi:hypothetical protein P4N68_04480 [Corynebacterium felinum]|uniref:Transmembrane protein n=1 Tax=Corynebacterium felinum TaxID=131318 RepID=A0ABU2BC45_9CORY|nr:hypothetical protein [Corynebacterium felinum]MDF5820341.1 hypothetical protein [Corynebacterium felinum]MDR7356207.1 hypothetical protein [Corynebacterium felinum]
MASLVRHSNGDAGTWGNCLLAGVGLGCGFAVAYYAAVVDKTEYPLRWIRLLAIALAVVSSFGITVATALYVDLL